MSELFVVIGVVIAALALMIFGAMAVTQRLRKVNPISYSEQRAQAQTSTRQAIENEARFFKKADRDNDAA